MTSRPITLGLVAVHADDRSSALLTIVNRVLDLFLKVMAPVAPATGDQSLVTALIERRDTMLRAGDAEQLLASGQSLIDACQACAEQLERQRAESRAEIASLLALLQDAVATIAATGSGLSQDVTTSVARLDALHRVTDIGQLKARLAAETDQLRQKVAERERAWTTTVSTFEHRVRTLERQLADTLEVASHDPLTGCANRRAFDTALAAACAAGRGDVVLALFDIDDFKGINDTHGHAAGDEVLIGVSRALASAVREHDVLGRLGGDEFALVLRGIALPKAEPRMRTLLKSVAEQRLVPDNGDTRVTLSCGLVEYSAGDTPATLLRRADAALYQAKHAGKSRVVANATPLIRDLLAR